jgi:hypothetical protein
MPQAPSSRLEGPKTRHKTRQSAAPDHFGGHPNSAFSAVNRVARAARSGVPRAGRARAQGVQAGSKSSGRYSKCIVS